MQRIVDFQPKKYVIEEISSNELIDMVAFLNQNGDEPVEFYLDTVGGDIGMAAAMADLISDYDYTIKVSCAKSAGLLLLSLLERHRIYALPTAMYMTHDLHVTWHSGSKGVDCAVQIKNYWLDFMKKSLSPILGGHDPMEELYFTNEEAKAWGVIGNLIEFLPDDDTVSPQEVGVAETVSA